VAPALGLLVYAGLLLLGAAPVLARARWPERAPRLGITTWLTLTGSAVASVVLGGLALLVPTVPVSADLARLLAACEMALQARYAHPGAALAGAGAVLALAVTGRVAWCMARALTTASLARRRHRDELALAGRTDARLGCRDRRSPRTRRVVPAWARPPGRAHLRGGPAFDGAQLAAIMAHERGHQRGRHHLLVCVADSLAAAFPQARAFGVAHEQVARLAEMVADDAAVSAVPRLNGGRRAARGLGPRRLPALALAAHLCGCGASALLTGAAVFRPRPDRAFRPRRLYDDQVRRTYGWWLPGRPVPRCGRGGATVGLKSGSSHCASWRMLVRGSADHWLGLFIHAWSRRASCTGRAAVARLPGPGFLLDDVWVPKTYATWADAPSGACRFRSVSGTGLEVFGRAGVR
jgi:hypothetical protein